MDSEQYRMPSEPILPQAFWFRIGLTCPQLAGIPRSGRSGLLLDLPDSCALPDLSSLEGKTAWAQLRVAWNPNGLGVSVIARGISRQQLVPDRPEGFASVQIWVDTRDTRIASRATRFCSRYVANIKASRTERKLTVDVAQRPIGRATVESPLCRPELIATRATLLRDQWTLELFLPASAVNGFDPETNRRLGFAYQVSDHVRDDQFLTVGTGFPVGENPSLWATLELAD
jgi:hypothetical protein